MKAMSDKEALKSFIMKLYFKKEQLEQLNNVKLFLNKKENKLVKVFGLPKIAHTTYFLTVSDGVKSFTVKVLYKEKDSIKHLLRLINKNEE